MPNQLHNEDDESFVVLSDESLAVSSDSSDQEGEDTSFAENNEDQDADSSTKSSAERELDRKILSKKDATVRELGSVSKESAKLLLQQAKENPEIRASILGNKELKNYIKKKFPIDYEQLTESSNDDDQELDTESRITQNVLGELKQTQLENEMSSIIERKGLKGAENVAKVKSFAKALMSQGASLSDAISGAIGTIRKEISAQPIMPSGSISRNSESRTVKISKSAYELGRNEFNLTDQDFMKYGNQHEGFLDSNGKSFTFKGGRIVAVSNEPKVTGGKGMTEAIY